MTVHKQRISILFAGLVIASTGLAEDARPQGGVSRDFEKQFRALDRNGDGFISRDELMADKLLSGGFGNADKDRNDKLDLSEFQALAADRSPDRSLGSVAPREEHPASAAGATGPK